MNPTVTQFPVAERTTDISIRDLVAPLFRRKRLLLTVFFSVFALAMLFFIVKGPSYSSHMSVLVNRERLDPLVSTEATTQMITNSTPVEPEEVNSEVELLTSQDVLQKVVLANGLENPRPGFSLGKVVSAVLHPYDTREDRVARAVKTLAKKLKTEVTTKTNVIAVTYSSSDPQLSYNVLQSLANFYTLKHVEAHRPAGSYSFFAQETQKYQDQLNDAESKLKAFGIDNGIADPEDQKSNLALQAANSVGALVAAQQAMAADEQRIRVDREQMSHTPERTTTSQASAANDKLIEDLGAALQTAETRRTQLVMKYDPSYPLVQEADQEIAQTKAALTRAEQKQYVTETTDRDPTYELLREDVAKTQSDMAAQQATATAARQGVKSIQDRMVHLDQMSIAQQDLTRQVKADEANYLLYLSKREQERTTDALDNTRIANVAIAVPPAVSVLPVLSWPLMILIALGSAVILSLIAVYLRDHLDSSFHTPAEVAETLGIPVVIAFPKKTA